MRKIRNRHTLIFYPSFFPFFPCQAAFAAIDFAIAKISRIDMSSFSHFRQCTVLVYLVDIAIVPEELHYHPSTADGAYGWKFCFYTHFISFLKPLFVFAQNCPYFSFIHIWSIFNEKILYVRIFKFFSLLRQKKEPVSCRPFLFFVFRLHFSCSFLTIILSPSGSTWNVVPSSSHIAYRSSSLPIVNLSPA